MTSRFDCFQVVIIRRLPLCPGIECSRQGARLILSASLPKVSMLENTAPSLRVPVPRCLEWLAVWSPPISLSRRGRIGLWIRKLPKQIKCKATSRTLLNCVMLAGTTQFVSFRTQSTLFQGAAKVIETPTIENARFPPRPVNMVREYDTLIKRQRPKNSAAALRHLDRPLSAPCVGGSQRSIHSAASRRSNESLRTTALRKVPVQMAFDRSKR